MTQITELIPRKLRILIYIIFGAAVLLNDAAVAAFQAVGHKDPVWLVIGGVILTKLVAAPIVVALFNVTPKQQAAATQAGVNQNSLNPLPAIEKVAEEQVDSGNGASALKQMAELAEK